MFPLPPFLIAWRSCHSLSIRFSLSLSFSLFLSLSLVFLTSCSLLVQPFEFFSSIASHFKFKELCRFIMPRLFLNICIYTILETSQNCPLTEYFKENHSLVTIRASKLLWEVYLLYTVPYKFIPKSAPSFNFHACLSSRPMILEKIDYCLIC